MKNKIWIWPVLIGLLVSFVLAGNFKIQYPVGTDIFIVDTAGDVNVTSGTIAENGVLLSKTYCALTGCKMTGQLEVGTLNVTSVLNVTAATIWFPANSLTDYMISDDIGANYSKLVSKPANIDEDSTNDITTTNIGIQNVTGANKWDSYDTTADFAADDIAEIAIKFNLTSCGTGNHLYISGNNLACEAESVTDLYVNVTGDTMTGNLTMNGAAIFLNNGANISRAGSNISNTSIGIDIWGNVIITIG